MILLFSSCYICHVAVLWGKIRALSICNLSCVSIRYLCGLEWYLGVLNFNCSHASTLVNVPFSLFVLSTAINSSFLQWNYSFCYLFFLPFCLSVSVLATCSTTVTIFMLPFLWHIWFFYSLNLDWLRRRLEKRIYIPLPSFESRKSLISINLRTVEVWCTKAFVTHLFVIWSLWFYFIQGYCSLFILHNLRWW